MACPDARIFELKKMLDQFEVDAAGNDQWYKDEICEKYGVKHEKALTTVLAKKQFIMIETFLLFKWN
jgi:hypothetical protein